ncbi:MAG: ester cyclase [Chloroflexota bacterium]
MSVEENKAVMKHYHEAVVRKDMAFIEAHPGLGKEFYQELFAAFPDIREEVQNTAAEGDWIAQRLIVSGTHQGTFRGMPATGKYASWQVHTMSRIVNGTIVESYGQGDVMSMMQQLGIGPGAGGRPQP